MKLRCLLGIFAVGCMVVGLNGGCLSLSMLNRENPDTKERLDAVERRVAALETANASRQNRPSVPLNSTGAPVPSIPAAAQLSPPPNMTHP